MAPHIPYIDVPQEFPIPLLDRFFPGDPHPPSIKIFGILVALGVWIGSIIAMRHARARRIDEKRMSEFIFWVVGLGFVGAHVLDAIFYHPQQIARDPLYILKLWEGISSYGGFIGATGGALLWRYRRQRGILNMCEVIHSAFPVAWVFGRSGCSSVHDHPGHVSQAWIAVRYPHLPEGWGRFDLGLYEMVLSIPLALAFLILWRRKVDRPLGFYTGIMCVYYAPIRFFLDFLRADEASDPMGGDPRYGGLTPAQWACFGLLALGLYFLNLARKGGSSMEPERVETPENDEEPDPEPEPAPAAKKRRRKAA